ncbi:MAG TPA: hypothetical protein VMW58_08755 [Anaerolineae bacterium]|nr:hypothetical protein [Anaerolineae bacterium]
MNYCIKVVKSLRDPDSASAPCVGILCAGASFGTGLRAIPFDRAQGRLRQTQDAAQDAPGLVIDPLQVPFMGEEVAVDDTGETGVHLHLEVFSPDLHPPPVEVNAPAVAQVEDAVDLSPPLEGERLTLIATRGLDTLCWLV